MTSPPQPPVSKLVTRRTQLLEGDVLRAYEWEEWAEVMDRLYSPDTEDVDAALCVVDQWRAGAGVNVSIEATACLLKARELDKERERAKKGDAPCNITLQDLSTLYSMAVVRLVNGLTGELETAGQKNRTVRQMAADLQIPSELVDIRHAATHKALPSIHELRISAALALEYLHTHYWTAQRDGMLKYRRRQKMAAAAAAAAGSTGAAAGGLLAHDHPTLHPYVANVPSVDQSTCGSGLSQMQMLLKMEAECPKGIRQRVEELEAALGLAAPAANGTDGGVKKKRSASAAGIWPVSEAPLDTILLTKQGAGSRLAPSKTVTLGAKRKRAA